MSNLTNLPSAQLFAELTDEQLETVVGGTLINGPLVEGPLVDNRDGNIQVQGIGGQVNKSNTGVSLLGGVTQGLLG